MDCPGCEMVSFEEEEITLDNGEVVPIDCWLDENGDDCDPDEATFCVAGPSSLNLWYCVDLDRFEPVTVH